MLYRVIATVGLIALTLYAVGILGGSSYEQVGVGQDAEGNTFTVWYRSGEHLAVSWDDEEPQEIWGIATVVPDVDELTVVVKDCTLKDWMDDDGADDIIVYSQNDEGYARVTIVWNESFQPNSTVMKGGTYSFYVGHEGSDVRQFLERHSDCFAHVGL